MSQQLDGPFKTFTAGEALAAFRRVKMSAANTVMYADAGEAPCGVTQDAVANNALVNVKLIKGGIGTFKVTAAGSFAVLATLYGAADGKVDDVASGQAQFVAVEAATADDGVVEAVVVDDVQPTGSVDVAADELAIPVTHRFVSKTTGADAEVLTLVDGVGGQLLTIYLAVDGGGAGTLTPTTMTGFATIVLDDAGDQVTLQFIDATTGWVIVGAAGVAAPPVITI